jgi:hypothetical protein
MEQLPLFQCHKKVRAAKITCITTGFNDGSAELTLEIPRDAGCKIYEYTSVKVDKDWLTRNPKAATGGYFVEYQENDKYTAYSPAAPFEGGYALIESNEGTE